LSDARLPLPLERALIAASRDLASLIEASVSDPAEYIPSRIRHKARDLAALLAYVDRLGRAEEADEW